METVVMQSRVGDIYGRKIVSSPFTSGRCAIITKEQNGVLPQSWLIDHGFDKAKKWDVVVQLGKSNELAENFVKEDIVEVSSVLIDLRVPTFDERLIFLKNTKVARDFWGCYTDKSQSHHRRIAMLLAMWEVKPCLYFLPKGGWS